MIEDEQVNEVLDVFLQAFANKVLELSGTLDLDRARGGLGVGATAGLPPKSESRGRFTNQLRVKRLRAGI
jgi:hypothetical protein